MFTRTRVLTAAALVIGICAVLALTQVGGAAARNLPAQAGFVPRVAALPSSLASTLRASGVPGTSVTPGANWVDGSANQPATFIYNPGYGWMIGSDYAYVGYYAYTNATDHPTGEFPQVGDVYYMHVVMWVIATQPDANDIEVVLPDNTAIAISSSNPLHCFRGPVNGTSTPLACPKSIPGTGTIPDPDTGLPMASIWLGDVDVPGDYVFEEQFPVRTTAPLDGVSNPQSYLANYNNLWATGRVDTGKQEYDWTPVLVPAAANTTITSKPASSTTSTSASFSFSSNKSGSTFDCRLGSGSWAACSSPKSYSSLALGSHTFSVEAIDSFGRADPTPASYSWTITSTTTTTTTPTTTTPTTTTPTTTTSTTTTPTTTTTRTSTTRTSTTRTSTTGTTAKPAVTPSGSSGKISAAHLSKKTFKRSEAAKVKLLYSFSHKSKHFAFLLSLKKGGKWLTVRSVKKTGSFKGSHTMTIKKLFGKKPIKAGRYHLKLSADKNSKLISFRIT